MQRSTEAPLLCTVPCSGDIPGYCRASDNQPFTCRGWRLGGAQGISLTQQESIPQSPRVTVWGYPTAWNTESQRRGMGLSGEPMSCGWSLSSSQESPSIACELCSRRALLQPVSQPLPVSLISQLPVIPGASSAQKQSLSCKARGNPSHRGQEKDLS